jgi:hypothetical protein
MTEKACLEALERQLIDRYLSYPEDADPAVVERTRKELRAVQGELAEIVSKDFLERVKP